MYKYAVFILSFGRPDNVLTYGQLRKSGYTGEIYIVCSTDDPALPGYREIYKDSVIEFDKAEYFNKVDMGDNLPRTDSVVYARNAVFDIARDLGLDSLIVLDDDYTGFLIRTPISGSLTGRIFNNLDRVFDLFIRTLYRMDIDCLSFGQGGDYIGGVDCGFFVDAFVPRTRKSMNVYFQRTDRPYSFSGRINEDVNAYITHGKTGRIFLTHPRAAVNQTTTQEAAGGLTDIYRSIGTYVKSFYSILYSPSSVSIRMMGRDDRRIHHAVNWNKSVPMIIRERYKKKR